jgi:haloacetate dehalogenase
LRFSSHGHNGNRTLGIENRLSGKHSRLLAAISASQGIFMIEIERHIVKANGIKQHYRVCGNGPPLVLLHGWPQTSYAWRKVMPLLARHYKCFAPDLRGMGDTDKPVSGYDIRTIVTDIRAFVAELGLENVYLVGTDWGGLAARRYALDWPGELERLFIVDIVPHDQMMANLNPLTARGAWHFFWNAVPDLPEQLVAHDVRLFLQTLFRPKYHNPAHMDEAIDEYVRAYSKPGALRGGFAYYAALFEENPAIDAENPKEKIQEKVRMLWGNSGGMGGFDVLDMWKKCAPHATGRGLDDCGHYIHEEQPEILAAEILAFGQE